MTYFSDFDSTEYYYNDEQLRKTVLSEVEEMYLEPAEDNIPVDLFDDLDSFDFAA
jgi:hypothetical protein